MYRMAIQLMPDLRRQSLVKKVEHMAVHAYSLPDDRFTVFRRFAVLQALCGVIAATSLGMSAQAAETEPKSSVNNQANGTDLTTAFRQAITTYPLVRSRRNEKLAASHDLEGANWGRFPSLSVDLNNLYRDGSVGQIDSQGTQHSVKIQQPLWTGGRITGQIEAMTARHAAAGSAVVEAEQAVLLQVVAAFADLMRASRKVEVASASLDEHQRLHDMIQRRMASDVSAKIDATLAAARLQQVQTELMQYKNRTAVAQATLGQLVGAPVQRVVVPQVASLEYPGVESAIDAAVDFSPEIARLRAVAEDATAQTKIARAAYSPQLVVGHEYRPGDLTAGQSRNQSFIALQLQTGSGFGLSSLAGVDASTARRHAAEETIETARRQLSQQVSAEWNDMNLARSQLPLMTEMVDRTRDIAASYLRQYTVGRKNWMDVMNGAREYTQSRYSLVDTETALLVASSRLDILTGSITAKSLAGQ